MLPGQDLFSMSGSGSTAVLYCNDIKYQIVTEAFERTEFAREKLLSAPESSGVKPITGQLLFGVPYQIASGGAIPTTARDFRPDDSFLDLQYRKFLITRLNITGAESANSDMGLLYTWSVAHKTLFDRFDAHQKFASGNVSIQYLTALQAETFSYLTTTGFSITTPSLGTLNNVIIRSLDVGIAYSCSTPQGLLVLNDYTLVVDLIQNLPFSA